MDAPLPLLPPSLPKVRMLIDKARSPPPPYIDAPSP